VWIGRSYRALMSFEENRGFGLILADVGEVIENQQMEASSRFDCGFEGELPPRDLELLDQVGGTANMTRQPFSMSARPMAEARWDFPPPGPLRSG